MARTRFHANWVLPITSPPIRDGWVDIENGLIAALGQESDAFGPVSVRDVNLGSYAILPGLVNAHTHVELSGLQGLVSQSDSMPIWARDVMQNSVTQRTDNVEAMQRAVVELQSAGTLLVGDITNTLDSVKVFDEGAVDAVVFHEMIGFDVSVDEVSDLLARTVRLAGERSDHRVSIRLAAHAPYSVSQELFRGLRAALPGPHAVHLAESSEEIDFLKSGTGVWKTILQERGRWTSEWRPPGTGAVDYLNSVGWLESGTLVVHGVQLTRGEMKRLALAGVNLVTCPRSNVWTGAGEPPIDGFYESGLRVAIGTDSLASVPDLNLFNELTEVRRLAPNVSASNILTSATLTGAAVLGRGESYGSIEPKKSGALIGVALPSNTSEVEEQLLSGVDPTQIVWLEDLNVD